jgi:hypothetical protein
MDHVQSERIIQTHLVYTQCYCERCNTAWAVHVGDAWHSLHTTPIPLDKPERSRWQLLPRASRRTPAALAAKVTPK